MHRLFQGRLIHHLGLVATLLAGSTSWAQQTASVTIRVSELSVPTGYGKLAVVGVNRSTPTQYVERTDTTVQLSPGAYELITPSDQGTFGTFQVTNALDVTGPTGALTIAGNAVGFDRAKLAPVNLQPSQLSAPSGFAWIVVSGVSYYIPGSVDPVLYLPPNRGTSTYAVVTPRENGDFGTFRVSSALQVTDVTGSLTVSGNALGFDRHRLAEVTIRASTLSNPAGRVSVFIAGVSSYINGTDCTLYLPSSRDATVYQIETPRENGDFGTFRVSSALQVTALTGSLMFADGVLGFDSHKLVPVQIAAGNLSSPTGLLAVCVCGASGYVWGYEDVTLLLPPSMGTSVYQVRTPRENGEFGTFRITPTLEVTSLTGALTFSGHTLGFDLSRLASLQMSPRDLSSPAGLVTIVIPGATGYVYGLENPRLFLPPNTIGAVYEVTTPWEQVGHFGTFTISSDLRVDNFTGSLLPLRDGGGATVGIGFDLCRLVNVDFIPRTAAWFVFGVSSNFTQRATLRLHPNYSGQAYQTGYYAKDGTTTVTGSFALTMPGGLVVQPVSGQPMPALSLVSCPAAPPTVSCVGAPSLPELIPTSAGVCSVTVDNDNRLAGGCAGGGGGLRSCTFNGQSSADLELGPSTVAIAGTAVDGSTASCTSYVQVVDRVPPILSCPAPTTIECTGVTTSYRVPATCADTCGACSVSCDPDAFPLGATAVECSALDASLNGATCRTAVIVVDTRAPVLDVSASPSLLWPPNHQLVPITVTTSAADSCDPDVRISCTAASSEPDDGLGDGDRSGDVSWKGGVLFLRAERAGRGPGRTYTINCTATDAAGNEIVRTATVLVPHSR